MRSEWQDYRLKMYRLGRGSLFWSAVLTAVFFVVYLPMLKPSEYLMSLKICLGYSVSIFIYLMLFYGAGYALRTWQRIRSKRVIDRKLPVPVSFALGISASAVGITQGGYLKAYWLNYTPPYNEILFTALMGCFVALVFLFNSLYREAKAKNQLLKASSTEAELHVFKNQMQPHFLFNSLNSLLSLIETKSADAPVMTLKLADLYREILANSNKNLATLESEVAILEKYLSLEKFRFGDRLQYTVQTPAQMGNVFLPPLILQTLVENAVKHGISQSVAPGSIHIDVQPKDDGYHAVVKNTGNLGKSASVNGLGLQNSKARLDLLYGDRHDFQIRQTSEGVHASFWFSGQAFT